MFWCQAFHFHQISTWNDNKKIFKIKLTAADNIENRPITPTAQSNMIDCSYDYSIENEEQNAMAANFLQKWDCSYPVEREFLLPEWQANNIANLKNSVLNYCFLIIISKSFKAKSHRNLNGVMLTSN